MKGTDKQVKWAMEIIEAMEANADFTKEGLKIWGRIKAGEFDSRVNDAGFWIDHRTKDANMMAGFCTNDLHRDLTGESDRSADGFDWLSE